MLNFELTVVQQIAILAIQLGVIIFAAKFCGDLAKKLKMPSVLGELSAGILIGPYVLGKLPLPLHGLENGLFAFTQEVAVHATDGATAVLQNITFSQFHSSLYAIAIVGSILLLFISGLETDLDMFFRYSVVGTAVGIGGVIFSFLFGDLIGIWAIHCFSGETASFMDPRCLFLGILGTATSVGITARILSEKKKIGTPEGVTILAAAVIDDVLGIICLAVVLGIVSAGGTAGGAIDWAKIGIISVKCVGIWLGATVIGLVQARYLAKFLKIFKSPAIFATLALGIALIVGGLFEQAGLAMIVGAYVVGLSLSKTDISFAIQNALHPLYNFFVPIFFVVMGMLVDIRVFADMNVLKVGLVFSLLAILAKVVGCALPAIFMNFNMIGSLRIGAGMVPRGEVALIIAGIGAGTMMTLNGKETPILDSRFFGVAIIMTLLTTVVAPPLLAALLNLAAKGIRKEEKVENSVNSNFPFPSEPLRDFVFKQLCDDLKSEGYMLSHLDKESGSLQVRKDTQSFNVCLKDNEIIFESKPAFVPFIHAAMYEACVDMHHALEQLKQLNDPTEIQKNMLDHSVNNIQNKQERTLLEKAISAGSILMELEATTKEGVIREMVDLLDHQGLLVDKELCCQDIFERESVISTCMQNGVAMPHGRTDGTKQLVAAIGIHKSGFDFDSLDGKPTKIFVLCLSPKNSTGPHIQFISSIASVLNKQEAVDNILNAKTPTQILSILSNKKQK